MTAAAFVQHGCTTFAANSRESRLSQDALTGALALRHGPAAVGLASGVLFEQLGSLWRVLERRIVPRFGSDPAASRRAFEAEAVSKQEKRDDKDTIARARFGYRVGNCMRSSTGTTRAPYRDGAASGSS
jgi:hypothetical protein